MHAAQNGHRDIVRLLLDYGANDIMYDSEGKRALFYAIERGYEDIALDIINTRPHYDIEKTLIHAIDKGCVRVVLELIEKNPDRRILKINESTPLIYALQQDIYVIQKGKVDVAKALIAKNVDINAQDKDAKTALMHALDPYNLYSLKSFQGQRSGEPRDYMYAYRDMILSLINHPSADLNLKDRNGDTALMYFSGSETNFMIARALIEKGADINIANNSGRTALMLAASEGNLTLVKFLLKQPGIEPDQLNKTLDEVIEFKIPGRAVDDKIIETLLKAGATLDETKYKDIVIEPKIKNKAEKYKKELSNPDLKILRNIKEGRIEFDSINQNFDLAKKKEKLISKMRYISILGYHEQMHNNLKKFLSETLELDIDGLSDTQIEKLGKTVKKIITNDQIEKIHNKSYSEKLAEELIIKVEMMKIKNRQNSEKSEDRSFADRATASKTTQGKSR